MAKKRKSFYTSLRDLTKVPLRDLKPIEIEKNRHIAPWSLRKKIITVVIVCLVLMIATITLGRSWGPFNTLFNTIASPLQQAFSSIGDWFGSMEENTKSADELRLENESLRQKLDALQYENTLQEVQLSKLQELMDLYELDSYYAQYPKEGAQVISFSGSNWYQSITIDKGYADGIRSYMPVLSGGGLFGHVDSVYQNYSRITSILSDDSYVYGEVLRSADHVGVQGDITLERDGLCKIEFYIQQIDIAVGDEIVTSSLSDVYPPGIRIGEIIRITEKGDGVTGIAYLKPYADIENISYALIITDMEEKPEMSEEDSIVSPMGPDVSSYANQESSSSQTEGEVE